MNEFKASLGKFKESLKLHWISKESARLVCIWMSLNGLDLVDLSLWLGIEKSKEKLCLIEAFFKFKV